MKGEAEKNPVFHKKAGFFIVQAAEKRPSAAFPLPPPKRLCAGRLILALLDKVIKLSGRVIMAAFQKQKKFVFYLTGQVVAAYVQVRLWPTHQLVGVARCRSLFVATPLSGFRGPCI